MRIKKKPKEGADVGFDVIKALTDALKKADRMIEERKRRDREMFSCRCRLPGAWCYWHTKYMGAIQ